MKYSFLQEVSNNLILKAFYHASNRPAEVYKKASEKKLMDNIFLTKSKNLDKSFHILSRLWLMDEANKNKNNKNLANVIRSQLTASIDDKRYKSTHTRPKPLH